MPTFSRRLGVATAAGVAVLVPLSGCFSSRGDEEPAAAPRLAAPQTVRVEKRDIHSVVVTSGNVVSSPAYRVPAQHRGVFSARTHVGERVRAGQRLGTVGDSAVTAPSSGTVVAVAREGEVPAAMPVVTIAYNGFGVSAPITDAIRLRLYGERLGAKASLEGGASGFDCPLVDPATSADDSVSALCLVPLHIRAFPDMPAHLGIDMGAKPHVLALPLSAVTGSAQQGSVGLVSGGTVRNVEVRLGVSDGNYVQITSGLEQGDEVLSKAPLF